MTGRPDDPWLAAMEEAAEAERAEGRRFVLRLATISAVLSLALTRALDLVRAP